MNDELKLFVVTHKPVDYLPEGRTFIGVGANQNMENVSVYDSGLENISSKNYSYCELTALYWLWKNTNYGYIGFEHYRRYFCSKANIFHASPLKPKKIKKILKKSDMIVSNQFKFKDTIYEYYKKNHISSDMDITRQAICDLYPEYLPDFDAVMQGHKTSMCNMFVSSKQIMDKYCEWLFAVLAYAEERIDISDRDAYQKRIYGFLAERLLNVWLHHHSELKIAHYPIYMPKQRPWIIKIKTLMKAVLK